MRIILSAAAMLFVASVSDAKSFIRLTPSSGVAPDFASVVARVNKDAGLALSEGDFVLSEDRPLAFNHYKRYDQVKGGARVRGMSIRIWSEKGHLVQAEAQVEGETVTEGTAEAVVASAGDATRDLITARRIVSASDDSRLGALTQELVWDADKLVRRVTIKARRGTHHLQFDAISGSLIQKSYVPFASADLSDKDETYSIPAKVYPIYEEHEGKLLPRRLVRLKHLLKTRKASDTDPFGPLREQRYLWSLHDPIKAQTPDGRAAGYWSMVGLRSAAQALTTALPEVGNTVASGKALLVGKYATINIHREAFTAFPDSGLERIFSPNLYTQWSMVPPASPDDEEDWELTPYAAYSGKTFASRSGALDREAIRDPGHNAALYMGLGFDEVQVYFAVNQLFESLSAMGFRDPDLGERPFHAFLFDPDIEGKDNAYYDSDTINFTTYSPDALNYARDNLTIWHELGHGVMDRLMGNELNLADTGGLSEGMADFVAELMLRATNGDRDFPGKSEQRIINDIGFFLTNEVHDDGEAYGGVMKSILDAAVRRFGPRGVAMTGDLVLEAMRLSRDHPELTAEAWFDHMKFADTLGRPGVRRKSAFASLIDESLAARNFAPPADRAQFAFTHEGKSVDAGSDGSRGNSILVEIAPDQTASKSLEVSLADGARYKFSYPVEVRVFYNSGPLQGALDWQGEDQEPLTLAINGPGETLTVPLTINGRCDFVNRSDGTCSDFAYVQIWNKGAAKPVAKKRFYLRLKNP